METLTRSDFDQHVEAGYNVVPLTATLQLDRETPVTLYDRLRDRAFFFGDWVTRPPPLCFPLGTPRRYSLGEPPRRGGAGGSFEACRRESSSWTTTTASSTTSSST